MKSKCIVMRFFFYKLIARLMVAKTHYHFWTPKKLPYEGHTERWCSIKFLKYPFLESKAVQTISERIVIGSKVDKCIGFFHTN